MRRHYKRVLAFLFVIVFTFGNAEGILAVPKQGNDSNWQKNELDNTVVTDITETIPSDEVEMEEEVGNDDNWYEGFYHEFTDEGTLVIKGYYSGKSKDIIIYESAVKDGKTYRTVLSNVVFGNSEYGGVETVTVCDGVYLDDVNFAQVIKAKIGKVKLSNWDNVKYMFSGNHTLVELDLSSFDTSQVTDMSMMFSGCTNLTELDLSNFDTSNVTDMSKMFNGCTNLTELDLSNFDTSNVTDMSDMFSGCTNLGKLDLSGFDNSNVTTMEGMFSGCTNLSKLDLSGFDTSNVTSMEWMFDGCIDLNNPDLSGFDTSNVTTMDGMFARCTNLIQLDLSSFDTSNVQTMHYMFGECKALQQLDISSFDTSQVTDMSLMFAECESITELDLSNFDTNNVTYMPDMFKNCKKISKLNLSSFYTKNVKTMGEIFYGCDQLEELDLTGFVQEYYSAWSLVGIPENLKILYFPDTVDPSIAIPSKEMESLTDIFIGDVVQKISLYSDYLNSISLPEEKPTIHASSGSYAAKYAREKGFPLKTYYDPSTGTPDLSFSSNVVPADGRYISVFDFSTGKPLEGVTMTSDGKTIGITDGKGQINVSSLKIGDEYLLKKTGYQDTTNLISDIYDLSTTYMVRGNSGAAGGRPGGVVFSAYLCSGKTQTNNRYDVLIRNVSIKNNKDYNIAYSVSSNVKKVELRSGKKLLGSGKNATVFNSKDISPKEGLAVYCFDGKNKLLGSRKLNISVESTSASGSGGSGTTPGTSSKVELGDDFSVTLNSDIPIIGGTELSLKDINSPIVFEEDGDKVKMGLGHCFLRDKTLIKKAKNYNWSDSRTFTELARHKAYKTSKNIEFSGIEVVGYLEGKKDMSDLSGHIFLEVGAKVKSEYQTTVPVGPVTIPVVVGIEVEGKMNADGSIHLKPKSQDLAGLGNAFRNAEFTLDIGGEISVKGSAGIGLRDIIHGGVYGEAKLSVKFGIFPDVKLKDLSLAGEIGLYGEILTVRGEWALLKDKIPIYENGHWIWQESPAGGILTEEDLYSMFNEEPACGLPLGSYSTWMPGDSGENGYLAEKAIQDNSDLNMSPGLVVCGDTVMMYFVTGAENCGEAARADSADDFILVYSLYDDANETWSSPKAVSASDNTADFEPVMYADDENGKIYALWQDAATTMSGVTELEDYVANIDLETAVFDTSNPEGGFSSLGDIRSENTFEGKNAQEQNPGVVEKNGVVSVFWNENETDNVFGLNGNSKIYKASFTEGDAPGSWAVTQEAESEDPVFFAEAGICNGQTGYAYVSGKLDEKYNISDSKINVIQTSGDKTEIEGSVSAAGVRYAKVGDSNTLTWYANGGIYYIDGTGARAVLADEGTVPSTKYRVVNSGGRTDLIYSANESYVSDIYRMTGGENGKLNSPVKVTDSPSDNYIQQVEAFTKNGQTFVIYNNMNATSDGNGEFTENKNSLRMGAIDDDYVSLDITNLGTASFWNGETSITEIYASVENRGTKKADTLKFDLELNGSKVTDFTMEEVALLPGSSDMYVLSVNSVLVTQEDDYTVTVRDGNGANSSDKASGQISLGSPMVQVDAYVTYIDNDRMLNIVLNNRGAAPASGKVSVNCAQTGKCYATFEYNSLSGNSSTIMNVEVDKKLFNDHDELDFDVRVIPDVPQGEDMALISYATVFAPKFSVTYMNNDEIIDVSTVSYNKALDLTEIVPASQGDKEFVGWYTKTDCKGRHYIGGETIKNDVILYAGFKGQKEEKVRVTGVSLDKHEISVSVGNSESLTATVSPANATNKSVKWSSSSENAVVDAAGKVTGISDCKAVITVETVDGGFKDYCKVTVGTGGSDPDPVIPDPVDPTPKPNPEPGPDSDDDEIPDNAPSSGIWVKGLKQEFAYTGSQIKPEIKVYDGRTRLYENKDYTLKYKNNTKPGTAYAVLTMKGNYSGSKDVPFTIRPASLITDISADAVYTSYKKNKTQKLKPVLYVGGQKLKYGKNDLSFTYPSGSVSADSKPYADAGTWKIHISAKNSTLFTGEQDVDLVIVNKPLMSAVSIKPEKNSLPYTGSPVVPKFMVKYKNKPLTEGTDYTVMYKDDHTDIGKHMVVFKGNNKDYFGSKTVTFKISGKYDLTSAKAGIEFDKASLNADGSVPYTSGGAKPAVIVKYDGKTLTAGKDYAVSYANHKALGTATATIKGKGSYKGSPTKTFEIKQRDINTLSLNIADVLYSSKDGAYKKTTIVFTDSDYKDQKLKKDRDYTVEYGEVSGNAPEAGSEIKITLQGKGNYSETINTSYRIIDKDFDLTKAKVTVNGGKAYAYTGKAVTPAKSELKVTIKNKGDLTDTDYDIIGCFNNVKKGNSAYIKLRGKGKYAGVKVVKFKIGAATMESEWSGVIMNLRDAFAW